MNEPGERLLRGPRGDRGAQGRPGEPLSRPVRRALVFLFLFAALIAVTAIVYSVASVSAQQASQRHQGQVTEQKICTTLRKLAALQPPPGTAPANPSRVYEQRLHATLAQLGPDLGCR